jgi:ribosomal protein S18 acetylase RimI-like enzyme
MELTYRTASQDDIVGIAEVYIAAFPESLTHFFGEHPPAPAAVAELMRVPLLAEPGCGTVAVGEGRIAGYCLAPAHVSRLRSVALHNAGPFLAGWLSGRYHLGLRPLRALLADKLATWRHRRQDAYHVEAHILSVAVVPGSQGYGIGRQLLQASLRYLAAQHVPTVRLEVRPENSAAIALYRSFGFAEVGETSDSQGPWLIMIKEMAQ